MCPYFADHTSWSTLFVAYICKRILKIGYLFTIFQVQCMHYLSGFFSFSRSFIAYVSWRIFGGALWNFQSDFETYLLICLFTAISNSFFLHSPLFLLWLHFDESHGRIDG